MSAGRRAIWTWESTRRRGRILLAVATARTYNGQVPGPMIRILQGDRVRIVLKNELPEETSIHWHGMRLPNAMDGVDHLAITQQPIPPGGSFTPRRN